MLSWKYYLHMEISKRIAIDTAIDEGVVKTIIAHSLDSLLRSSRNSESMELTGFGNFYLKKSKIPYYIKNFGVKIEKLKVNLATLTNQGAIDKLRGQIEINERELIKLKKRYGLE